MSRRELIVNELERIPDELLQGVLDFIHFLQAKRVATVSETALLSESALEKDWLSPEDEAAWKDL